MKPHLEKSMRRIRSIYRENSTFIDYEHEPYKPPVRITEIGASHWGEGDSYTIKNRSYFSINLVSRGNILFRQRSYRGIVNPDQVFLSHLNCKQIIKTGDKGFATKRFIFFGGELLQAHLLTTRLVEYDVITPIDPQSVRYLFKRAYKMMREKPDGFIEELMILAQQIFFELGRSIGDDHPEELCRGIAFIQRHLNRPIKLEEICHHMHVSARHCVRLFNTHLNMPPMRFVHHQKHKWAESLLQRSQLSIKEVASILGYEDQFYFSNRFKKFARLSPTEFRSTNQN
jgi:AraC-like DNA-binding protein